MDRSRHSSIRTGLASGLVSAIAVCGIFFAAGAFEDGGGAGSARGGSAGAETAASIPDLFARSRRGVVLIDHRPPGVRPRTGPPRRDDGVATGSGFVLDGRGHVVTNHHVVAGRGRTTVRFEGGRKPVGARVVGRDPATDLALVRVDPGEVAGLDPLPLGDSGSVRVGDTAIAIGNPFGLERTLTAGVVSATDRRIDAPGGGRIADVVQTDASINSGSSGGPLLDAAGRVIGVNSQARGGGIAFAVPVDTVKRVVGDLRRNGRVERAYLGVATSALTSDAARERRLRTGRGALVSEVARTGPAADAGVRGGAGSGSRAGDVIVALDGRPVRGPRDVADAIERRRPGDEVEIAVIREGRRITLRARLGDRRRAPARRSR